MIKIFNSFTTSKHQFIVREDNMIEVMNMIQLAIRTGCNMVSMQIRECDWVLDSGSWTIRVELTNDQWNVLLCECKKKNYQLMVKDNPNEMYFTKRKES